MIRIINRAQEEAENNKKQHKHSNQTRETRICRALCCTNNTRFSISSSSSSSSSSAGSSDRHCHHHNSISSLTHYMVQEKLEQMIREREEATNLEKMRRKKMRRSDQSSVISHTKFIVMMAMEKCSYDPRQDFRDSMIEMIVGNKIKEADELRSLLDYYLSMNPREYRSVILEIYYEVCADLFLCS